MAKKKEEVNKLETIIKVKYNIGSKTHEEEFERYCLFGKWMTKNWRRVRILDIRCEGSY